MTVDASRHPIICTIAILVRRIPLVRNLHRQNTPLTWSHTSIHSLSWQWIEPCKSTRNGQPTIVSMKTHANGELCVEMFSPHQVCRNHHEHPIRQHEEGFSIASKLCLLSVHFSRECLIRGYTISLTWRWYENVNLGLMTCHSFVRGMLLCYFKFHMSPSFIRNSVSPSLDYPSIS